MTRLPAPSVVLDDQLCFALYAASRAVTARYRPMLDAIGLTYPQYLVMMVLWESDGASVGTLCDRLYLDSGTLTPLITRLESAGLVDRRRSRRDARVVDVHLTAAGKRLERRAASVPEALLCRIGLDLKDYPRIHRELKTLFDLVVTKEKAA
jgi:DNA-binding MarR family transcriptional regulator